jgi:ribonuclease E
MLVYEEGSLVKRSIRDLYNKDIDEVLVAGEQGYKEAKQFMHMLMPSHSKNVKAYRDTLPIFTRFGIESQLDAMFQPVVQLRSGGYVVINQTEALVAIDVNSGRATREHHIEDTALKTNVEAAEEIARQLRLRDLAGLIVIDFIDMDEKRNNRTVERKLKDALKHDRARIQVGHISHFGLLEMSRQRIRSSVLESSTEKCPQCGGTGHIRSVSSVSLQLLRSLEEALLKSATHNLTVRTRTDIALYLLNHKRAHLRALEERFQLTITINADATIAGQLAYVVDKGEQVHSPEQAKAIAAAQPTTLIPFAEEDEEEFDESEAASDAEQTDDEPVEIESADVETMAGESAEDGEGTRDGVRRRRRRRRGRRGEPREAGSPPDAEAQPATAEDDSAEAEEADGGDMETAGEPRDGEPHDGEPRNGEARDGARRRRRGRRGGRRNRRGREGEALPEGSQEASDQQDSSAASGEQEPRPVAEWSEAAPQARFAEPMAARGQPEDTPRSHQHEQHSEVREQPQIADSSANSEPRRRSTVREPAPVNFEPSEALPAPPRPTEPPPVQPVVVSSSVEDENRPRRSGWWSKRG